jgi:rod shape determining protein RodA
LKGGGIVRRFFQELKDFPKKCDWVLLLLCLVTAAFGLVVITSATSAAKFEGNTRYIVVQLASIILGVVAYAIVSSIDIEFMSEQRNLLVIFNIFLLLLLIPFGTDNNTGNRSWLDLPLMPMYIQPAEICKITYIIIMASVMNSHQNSVSSIPSVLHMVLHLGILGGLK